jgi:hypothetical protein
VVGAGDQVELAPSHTARPTVFLLLPVPAGADRLRSAGRVFCRCAGEVRRNVRHRTLVWSAVKHPSWVAWAGQKLSEGIMILHTPQTEAQEFFKEAFPFPSAFTAFAVLAAGDVAIVVSMLLSLG